MQLVAQAERGTEVGTIAMVELPCGIEMGVAMPEIPEVPSFAVRETMRSEVDKLATGDRDKDALDVARVRAMRNKMAEDIMVFLRSEAGLRGSWVSCFKGGQWGTLGEWYAKGLKLGRVLDCLAIWQLGPWCLDHYTRCRVWGLGYHQHPISFPLAPHLPVQHPPLLGLPPVEPSLYVVTLQTLVKRHLAKL